MHWRENPTYAQHHSRQQDDKPKVGQAGFPVGHLHTTTAGLLQAWVLQLQELTHEQHSERRRVYP